MSKLYLNHKRVFIASVLLILSVVLVTFLAIYFVAIKSEKTPIAIDENGNELISGKVYDMPSNLIFTSNVEEVSDNDGIILKAILKPATVADKELKWSVAWKDPTDTFAVNNGDASNFVSVSEKSIDSAEIKCLKPFGAKIVINVVSFYNSKAKASCEVDYMRRFDDAVILFTARSSAYPNNNYWNPLTLYNISDSSIQSIDFPSSIFYEQNYLSESIQSVEVRSSYNDTVYTLEDNIVEYNVKFEPSEIVKQYYASVIKVAPYFKVAEITNTSSFAVESFLEVIGYPIYAYGEPEDYNNLVKFYQNNLNAVFFTATYTFTMESGLVYSGTQDFTFNIDSLGIVPESIELDKGSIKL